ncbi:GTP-binding protein Rhes-like isoform X2 [Ruditapes philippinarum]|uniref:GTP-binding protein Rhes-like isoform X2 n=1 Tax=Ruditapes philippinarum TaxID=129788 RepID=UPI00295B7819|nr:GTP-binding protein Rhes-like isoform X2 [Ruditapes philippinarum]
MLSSDEFYHALMTQNRPWSLSLQDDSRDSVTTKCLCWTGSVPSTPDMALVEQGENAPDENCRRLVVLGSSKVGKTSIVSRFLNNKYDETYTPTIEDFHRKIYKIRGEAYRLDILDTSGNHPFPAMRRLSFITGDLFILVYCISNRESFEEVTRLRNQIIECKSQCKLGSANRKTMYTPMILVGNKCDREKDRVIDPSEPQALIAGQQQADFIETSAKKNVNIEDIFVRLFKLAKLPTEMSPALHRKVNPSYISNSAANPNRKGVSIRRKMSDACGAIAPNVRRPSIRTDLLVAQTRTNLNSLPGSNARDSRCVIQ